MFSSSGHEFAALRRRSRSWFDHRRGLNGASTDSLTFFSADSGGDPGQSPVLFKPHAPRLRWAPVAGGRCGRARSPTSSWVVKIDSAAATFSRIRLAMTSRRARAACACRSSFQLSLSFPTFHALSGQRSELALNNALDLLVHVDLGHGEVMRVTSFSMMAFLASALGRRLPS